MRKTLIAGNWKLNGTLSSIKDLLGGISPGAVTLSCDMAVCVPYPYLSLVSELLDQSSVSLGAQDVSENAKGAYTGEVSAEMLSDFRCVYGLVGHSERRSYHAETDSQIACKFGVLKAANITPVLCVGETLAERDEGITLSIVSRQIMAVIDKYGIECLVGSVIAYEPVWAIGTGRTATPEQAQAVHSDIRSLLAKFDKDVAAKTQILYGGSMNAGNAKSLLAMPDIDGGLIGGASLKADDFLAIGQAA